MAEILNWCIVIIAVSATSLFATFSVAMILGIISVILNKDVE